MANFFKKSLLTITLCSAFITPAVLANDHVETANPLLYAVAWKQTAAEYQALYYQGFITRALMSLVCM